MGIHKQIYEIPYLNSLKYIDRTEINRILQIRDSEVYRSVNVIMEIHFFESYKPLNMPIMDIQDCNIPPQWKKKICIVEPWRLVAINYGYGVLLSLGLNPVLIYNPDVNWLPQTVIWSIKYVIPGVLLWSGKYDNAEKIPSIQHPEVEVAL